MSAYLKSVKNPLVSTVSNHIDGYPTPINLSYLWGFGSLAGIALVVQIVTGVLLAMHYAAEIHLAFNSVEHIMRDVKGGVILRYIHANGASMFFIVVYTHIFRGLYYGSYFQPRSNLWYSGILIFILMMATAFMGYVLPWGQMSFWGATVITNLFSAIPGIGNSIVQLLWGGFSVDNPTLNRFFSLHYFVPFIIAGAAMLHLILLHQNGSNNPLGVNASMDKVPFYPYFYVKDLFGFFLFVLVFSFFVIYAPNLLGHPDNYIEANPLVTPAHIVPEWYFLPFYAVLRTIPDKLGGVLLMGVAIVVLAVLPVVDTSALRSNFFKPLNLWFFWFFFANSVSLGWIGQEIVESPFIEMANFVTFSYFAYFIFCLPNVGFIENSVITHNLRRASLFFFMLSNSQVDLYSLLEIVETSRLLQIIVIILYIITLAICFKDETDFIAVIHKTIMLLMLYLVLISDWELTAHSSVFYSFIWETKTLSGFTKFFSLYGLLILFFFFYGAVDRFLIKNNKDIEYSFLILFIFIGSLIIFYVCSIVDIVLSLEVIALSSYALVAFARNNRFSTFVGVQYFIVSSFPSAILILGASLLYKNWGSLLIDNINTVLEETSNAVSSYLDNGGYKDLIKVFKDGVLGSDNFTSHTMVSSSSNVVSEGNLISNLLHSPAEESPSSSGDLNGQDKWKKIGIIICMVVLIGLMSYIDVSNIPTSTKAGVKVAGKAGKVVEAGSEAVGEAAKVVEVGAEVADKLPSALENHSDFIFFSLGFLKEVLTVQGNVLSFLTTAALILVFFNLLFKITAAPFHFWAPSIYGKAPIATSTFLSIFSKAVIFFLIYNLIFFIFYGYSVFLIPFFLFCGVLSVFFGMIGAFVEKYIKRFFVYSSMGHVGFMLIGLSLFSFEGLSATFHYLFVYFISSFIMWFVLLNMGTTSRFLVNLKWLKTSEVLMAFFFALLIFSMSGVPPLGGFFIKFDALSSIMESSRFYINYILFIFTVASFFYYLRLIKIMYFDSENSISFNSETSKSDMKKRVVNYERLVIIVSLFLFLVFYMIIIQKPWLIINLDFLKNDL